MRAARRECRLFRIQQSPEIHVSRGFQRFDVIGIALACSSGMIVKRIFLIMLFAMTSSCARKAEVRAPEVVHTERYLYVQDDQGRWLIVTTAPKDQSQA